MNEKVACIECGALILPDTAARTGGRCMPCKNGIRKNIEASKEYYARERELDKTCPFRALWRELVDKVHNRPDGFELLNDVEKQYFAVRILVGEVYNGGFDQYYHNSSANYYRYAELGLLRIGAKESLALLRSSKEVVFGDEDVPKEQFQRRLLLKAVSEYPALELLDSRFWSDPDKIDSKLERFAIEEGMVRYV